MDKDSRPKRYFWRRGAAFVVDFLLAYVLAVGILMAVDAVTGGHFYYWGGIATRTACEEARPSPFLDEVMTGLPIASGWNRAVGVCEQSAIGGKTTHTFIVTDRIRDGAVTRTGTFTIPVTETGDQYDASLKLDPTVLVAYLLMLLWSWRLGQSPGKRLLGLVVRPMAGAEDTGSRRLRRELLRLGPLAMSSLINVVFALAYWAFLRTLPAYLQNARFIADNLLLLLTPFVALGLLFAAYYAIPLIRWRGQTFYDRLAGTIVVRARADDEAVG